MLYKVGDKIVYGENGACNVEAVGELSFSGAQPGRKYYTLRPLAGSGTCFVPVDTTLFIRPVISKNEALAFIDSIPSIEPAVCYDNRFNHVDAFYRELFKQHTNEALVSIIKGLRLRMTERKTKSGRIEATAKRAQDMLHGELSIALGIEMKEVEQFITERLDGNQD